MRSGRRVWLASPLAVMAGCASPLGVQVRDGRTHEPIGGATVVAAVPSRDHPQSVATLLGRTAPRTTRSTTDAQGRAILSYIEDRPLRLIVMAQGLVPADRMFEADDGWFGGEEWTALETGDPGGRPIEVRAEHIAK